MKTKFKGTKGKWVISPSCENYIADISDNFAIAKAFNNSFIQKGESDANAKLIANAPELLFALKEMISFAEFHGHTSSTEINNARKVLEETLS